MTMILISRCTEEASGGLNGGQVFGIVIGVVLLVGLPPAVVWFIWHRREGEIPFSLSKNGAPIYMALK